MNILTAVSILLLLFVIRFLLPFSLIMVFNWFSSRFAVR